MGRERGSRLGRYFLLAIVTLAVVAVAVGINTHVWGDPVVVATVAAADLAFLPVAAELLRATARWGQKSPVAEPSAQASALAPQVAADLKEGFRARSADPLGRLLPISWNQERVRGDITTLSDALASRYHRLENHRLLVLGEPGSGKSYIAQLLALGLLRNRAERGAVPVVLQLSTWDPVTVDWDDWVVGSVSRAFYAGRGDVARLLLEEHLLLPILDGLDEMPENARPIAIRQMNESVPEDLSLVITCRKAEYEDLVVDGGPRLRNAARVNVQPVAFSDLRDYLESAPDGIGARWRQVLDAVADDEAAPLRRALSTPLMASTARRVYIEPNSDPHQLLLEARRLRSRLAIEDYLTNKGLDAAYLEDPRGSSGVHVPLDRARRYLAFLARSMHEQGAKSFYWWRLGNVLSPWAIPALSIAIGSVLLVALIPTTTHLIPAGYNNYTPLWVSASAALLVASLTAITWHTVPAPEPRRIRLTLEGSLGRFGRGFLLGLRRALLLVVPSLFFQILTVVAGPDGWTVSSTVHLVQSAAAFLAAASVLALATAVHSWIIYAPEQPAQSTTASIIRADRRMSAVTATLSALIVGTFLVPVSLTGLALGAVAGEWMTNWPGYPGYADPGLVFESTLDSYRRWTGPAGWASVLVFFGLSAAFLTLLTHAWPRFVLSSALLAMRGRVPSDLAAFLSDAHGRDVLRDLGGTYQFRHSRLQERLVNDAALARLTSPRGRPLAPRQRYAALASAAALLVLGTAACGWLLAPKNNAALVIQADAARSLSLSPDGRYLSMVSRAPDRPTSSTHGSGSDEGKPVNVLSATDPTNLPEFTLRAWDLSLGAPVGLPRPLAEWTTAGDGGGMAVLDYSGHGEDSAYVELLTASGQLVGPRISPVSEAVYSPDGQSLATYSRRDHEVRVWDTRSGTLAADIKATDAASFTADGRFLVTKDRNSLSVRYWDAYRGIRLAALPEIVHPLRPHSGVRLATSGNAFWIGDEIVDTSTNGQLLVVGEFPQASSGLGGYSGAARLRVLAQMSKDPAATFAGALGWSFSERGDFVAVTTVKPSGNSVQIDAVTVVDRLGRTLDHWTSDVVDDDAFVGQVLLTRRRAGAWDAREAPFTMVSRHLSQGDLRQESHGNWFSIGSTVYTDSGRVSTHTALSETQSTSPSEDAIWSPGLLVILDRPSHPVTVDLQDNGYQATFSGAGDFLATDDGTGELGYWSAKSGRFIERLRGHTDFLLDVAVSSNGSVVASVCRDGTVRVWRPKPTP